MLEALIHGWGYVGIGVGAAVEGEAVLVLGGVLAHHGLFRLPLVMLAAFLGSFVADQLWFALGRWVAERLRTRARFRERIALIERLVRTRGDLFVVGFRFLIGLRTLTPIALGSSGYPRRRFAVLNAVGAALWALAFGAGGWVFGSTLEVLLGRARRFEEALVRAVVVTIAAVLVIHVAHRIVSHLRSLQPPPCT